MRILGETVALAETKKLTNLYVPTLLALHPAISIILDLYLWTLVQYYTKYYTTSATE